MTAVAHTRTSQTDCYGRSAWGRRWEGAGFGFVIRQSLLHPGMVFVQNYNGQFAPTDDAWLEVPPWVHAAIGDPAADPAGPLDWLLEARPDLDWLHAAVARIAAADEPRPPE